MSQSDRTNRVIERATQCVDRARRVLSNPVEAVDLVQDLRDLAGELFKWGLGAIPATTHLVADDEPGNGGYHAYAPVPEPAPAPTAEPHPGDGDGDGKAKTPPEVSAAPGEVRAVDEMMGHDQLYKVMRVLYAEADGERRYLTAREIADAAREAGLSILPGNVRKILRTRAARHVDTRLRVGDTGKVTEFRLASRGKSWFEKTYPVH